MSSPQDLIDLLKSPSLRNRNGLWLLPANQIANAPNLAARHGLDASDLRQGWLDNLPEGTRYARITEQRILQFLGTLSNQSTGSDPLLLYHLDLLLARLSYQECQNFWDSFFRSFPHHRRALLALMPHAAHALLPPTAVLDDLEKSTRLFIAPH
ncbi:MAG: hypothetical protein OHK0052_13280 [Anaerolineales bacterium]